MKFNRIVGFGDSWIYGDELLDPVLSNIPNIRIDDCRNTHYRERKCFLGQLAQHYNVDVENYGIPGGSLQSTIWTYLNWASRSSNIGDALIIVWLTESDRASFYSPNNPYVGPIPYIHSTWVDSNCEVHPKEFVNFIKQFQVLSNCRELAALNYQQTVMFFDGVAARHNLSLLQFNGAPAPCTINVPTLVSDQLDWITEFRDRVDNQNRELVMPGDHPNEKGHTVIRDTLIQHINRAILAQ